MSQTQRQNWWPLSYVGDENEIGAEERRRKIEESDRYDAGGIPSKKEAELEE